MSDFSNGLVNAPQDSKCGRMRMSNYSSVRYPALPSFSCQASSRVTLHGSQLSWTARSCGFAECRSCFWSLLHHSQISVCHISVILSLLYRSCHCERHNPCATSSLVANVHSSKSSKVHPERVVILVSYTHIHTPIN